MIRLWDSKAKKITDKSPITIKQFGKAIRLSDFSTIKFKKMSDNVPITTINFRNSTCVKTKCIHLLGISYKEKFKSSGKGRAQKSVSNC